ncbi:MAG: MMPL family transporter, partial [Bifidobacteriaceae bacterium]|nr:MMPL family transporter [Bifidobacteriaceae bacterium]
MSSLLWSLGRWAVRRRRFVVVGWLVLIAVIGGLGMTFNQGLNNDVTIPGTESTIAMGRLAATFPQSVESSAQVLVVVPKGETIKGTPAVQQAIEQSIKRFEKLDQVDTVTSPYQSTAGASINKAGDATILTVNMNAQSVSITDQTKDQLQSETDRLGAALPKGSEASLGGTLFADEFPTLGASEGGGLVLALVILVITLGSLVAAGLPILNAVAGVGVTMGLVYLSTNLFTVNATTPLLAIMLGLAVGLDYSLFITSRHRDQLAAGADPAESVATAVATGGSAVVFAGSTVIIALLGLSVAGIGFLTVMGAAAALGVFLAVAASLTLLPALLGMCGQRLRPRRARRVAAGERRAATVQAKVQAKKDRRDSRRQKTSDAGRSVSRPAAGPASSPATAPADAEPHTRGQRFFAGWVRTVTRRPAITIAAVVVVLLFVAWPALGLRLCLPDAGQMPKGSGARVTYDRIAQEFGEGFNGPLIVEGSIVTSNDPITLMNQIGAEIKKLPGVADVPLATPNQTGDTGIVQVIPEGGPDSVQTE